MNKIRKKIIYFSVKEKVNKIMHEFKFWNAVTAFKKVLEHRTGSFRPHYTIAYNRGIAAFAKVLFLGLIFGIYLDTVG